MTKAVYFSIGLAALFIFPTARAQDSSTAIAVNEAVLRQANTIVLRQKLSDARDTAQRGDIVAAAKLYQDACTLADQIGSGIDTERTQAIAGLTLTRLQLAREAQSQGDLREAINQVDQVLKVDPQNQTAIAFKKQCEQMLAAMKGHIPDAATVEQVPQIVAQKTDASTLVRDGKLLFEMGKLDESEVKLNDAIKLDPDNTGAYYYLNLIKQARYARDSAKHNLDYSASIAEVEKQWVLPTSKANLPVPNPYVTNTLIYTGPGRQSIISKLNLIHLDNVSFDGLPLSEVLRNLSEQSRLRDPERKGINFLINPNADQSGPAIAGTGVGGAGGAPGGGAIDPATGLPVAPAGGASTGGEAVDVGSFTIKIPSLTDVRLADVLDAIVLVSDHPLKYSVQDFAVVFQAKGAESPVLMERVFKVDPNTFYSGLESVGSSSFGSVGNSSGGGGSGGSSGGGGGSSGQSGGAVVGVVNAFAGAGSLRNQGGSGGGGGGGGSGQGATANLGGGTANGNAAANSAQGGIRYVTTINPMSDVSDAARAFFTTLGVNLNLPAGKSVFFNDRLGLLFVKATEQDLDTIERALQVLNQVAPQVHIKSRFIEVQQSDSKALGFDWYLGQFGSTVTASGGSEPSQNVPVNSANPLGAFPGNTVNSLVGSETYNNGQATEVTDQLITGGLRQTAPALATITGILTDPNFRVVIRALEQRSGVETLAEPEAVTTSGRQVQMRATQVITVVASVSFQAGTAATTTTGTTP